MAHRSVTLDVGSHSVKVLIAESSFASSSFKVRYYTEEPVHPLEEVARQAREQATAAAGGAGRPAPEQQVDSLQEVLTPAALLAIDRLKARGFLEGDTVAISYSLAHCLQTEIDLPPALKRDKVEEILSVQVEDHFPVDHSELVSDVLLSEELTKEGQRTVLVVATPQERLKGLLLALEQRGVDPAIVELSPARLLAAYRGLKSTSDPATCAALIDIGHAGTDLCIVQGDQIKLLRRLAVGGRHFTEALAEHFKLPLERAEQGKHSEGYVELGEVTAQEPHPSRIHAGLVCRKVASLLADELSRSFHGHLARGGQAVERLVFCGGGSLLQGLTRFLSLSLGIPAETLSVPAIERFQQGAGVKAVAPWGLIARSLGRRPASQFNLRRGSLTYRGSFEFIQSRIPILVVFLGLLIGALVFSTVTRRNALEARREAYEETLVMLSEPVFGQPIRNPREVVSRLQEATSGRVVLPEYTAYELFRDISTALVDLRELGVPVAIERMTIDIQRDVITIRGSTDSAISVDEIMSELGGLECITDVTQERTTQNRTTGDYEFELRAVNSCS